MFFVHLSLHVLVAGIVTLTLGLSTVALAGAIFVPTIAIAIGATLVMKSAVASGGAVVMLLSVGLSAFLFLKSEECGQLIDELERVVGTIEKMADIADRCNAIVAVHFAHV